MIATGRQASRSRDGSGKPNNQDSAAERYEVLERVGDGTLFVVYRVRDRATNQIFALKALKGAYNRHLQFAQSIAQAAQRVRQLSHPNVEQLREVGEEEGTLYIVSEWLAGASLEEQLRRVPLRQPETIAMLRQSAEALHYLHERGVTHGDLRPRQILTTGNRFCLTDIGYVGAFTAAGMIPTDVLHDAVYYMAPERIDGAPPSVAADLYALGVTLYRALSGRVPFDGPSALSVSMRHRNDVPLRPSQFNPACPPALETIALRLLEKDPKSRYASAAEVLSEIGDDARSTAGASLNSATNGAVVTGAVDGDASADDPHHSLAGAANPRRGLRAATADTAGAAPLDAMAESAQRQMRRRRERTGAFLAILWTLIAAGLLCGILYGMYFFWLKEIPPEVTVPAYVGLSQDAADDALSRVGLKLHVNGEIYNRRKPPGTVIDGDTPAGKIVREGRTVEVRVSRGEEPIAMQDFSDLSLDQARSIIAGHGMRLGQVQEQFHDTEPKGYICGQYPEAGQPFRRSEPITLIVSRGPQPSDKALSPDQLPPPGTTDIPEAGNDQSPSEAPNAPIGANLVSRVAHVRVIIPRDAGPQDVRIIVYDANGEHTEYEQTHDPGDVIVKKIRVTRAQGDTALIRVYVGTDVVSETHV